MMELGEFCTETNISLCFELISNQLNLFDLPRVQYIPDKETDTLVLLTNVLWALIRNEKSNITKINDCKECITLLSSQITQLNQQIRSFESKASAHLVDIGKLKNQLSLRSTENKDLTLQIKLLKKECNKLISSSNLDRKLHLKDISDKNDVIKNLNSQLFDKIPSNCGANTGTSISLKEMKSSLPIMMNTCIKTLDSTVQNLLSENASIRNSLLNVFIGVLDIYKQIKFKYKLQDIGCAVPESLFELHSVDFIDQVECNVKIILDVFQDLLICSVT